MNHGWFLTVIFIVGKKEKVTSSAENKVSTPYTGD